MAYDPPIYLKSKKQLLIY